MRAVWSLIVAIGWLALCYSQPVLAQSEQQESKQEPTASPPAVEEPPAPPASPATEEASGKAPADAPKDKAQEASRDTPALPPIDGGDSLAPLPDDDSAPLPPPPTGFSEVTAGDSRPTKPPLNLVDLHGYYRLRGDLTEGLHLSLPSSDRDALFAHYPRPATGKGDTLAGANMRFRLEPTLNISEDVRIMAQVDMLDNLVLGTTPVGYPASPEVPLVVLGNGQSPVEGGDNALTDSVRFKRVWGEVTTPLGLLRFGRMGSHWGLGLLENDGGPNHLDRGPLVTHKEQFAPVGRCLDCDQGTTVDRILFITNVAGHYVVPMVDFSAEGPVFGNRNGRQPLDADQLDDVTSWGLAVYRNDSPDDIHQALARGDYVLDYGAYFSFRNQAFDAIDYNNRNTDAAGNLLVGDSAGGIQNYAMRNAELYIPDLWARFMQGKLRLEAELVMVFGKVKYDTTVANLDEDGDLASDRTIRGRELSLTQFGGAVQGDFFLMNDALILGMEVGFASGDNSRGPGLAPFAERAITGESDDSIDNFRFHPDYHIDQMLWREVYGTVTDAWYMRPTVQYNISEGFGAKLSIVYSSALNVESTRGRNTPLGLELDADFFYFSDDNFHAGISYGMLVPFSGLNDLGNDDLIGGDLATMKDTEAQLAHRIQGRLVLFF